MYAGAADDDYIVPNLGPLAHNTAPSNEMFGANRYNVDTGGHSGYWDDPDSDSLRNQGAIIGGQPKKANLIGEAP